MKTNIVIKNGCKSISMLLVIFIISIGNLIAQTNVESYIGNNLAYTTSRDHSSLDFYTGSNEKLTEIEAWMKSVDFWNDMNPKFSDNNLSIESWMTDTNYWNDIKLNLEEPIQIENWMMDTDLWKKQESELEIEAWMKDNNYWTENEKEETLTIESWMSNNNYWNN